MKIMEIIPQLNSGGAERFVVDLCNELSKRHEVKLVVFHSFDKLNFYIDEISRDVSVVNMEKRDGRDFGLFYRLLKLIRDFAPDIVHTHLSAIVYVFLACFVCRKVKFIHTVHNDAEKEAEHGLNRFIRKALFKLHRVHPVTISEESQRSFQEFYNLPSTLVYNGSRRYVQPSNDVINKIRQEIYDLKINKDSFTVLNVARIQPQKNQVELVKAIHSLNKRGLKIELIHIGSVADMNMEKEIREINSPYVHLMGKRTNPRDYMEVCDAFCLSSIFEGMPITLIECFSVGALPVCTPVGGMKNMIIDMQNGLLADGCNQCDLEKVLLRAVSLDTVTKEKIRNNSRLSFEKFNIETSTSLYENLMSKLMQ